MENKEKNIILQVGVKIFLKNSEGKSLLLHRSLRKYPEIVGRWDIPGGRITPGTPLIENLKREVQEETGLALAGEPKLIAAQDILRSPDRHIVRLTYTGKANGDVKLDTEENEDYGWFIRSEIKQMEDVDMYFRELIAKDILWQ